MTEIMINPTRLLERFIRYVRIDTTANSESTSYPSSPGQLVLGKMLLAELQGMGLKAEQNEHGLVLATIPANTVEPAPVVAFNAHLDTSPETSGKNVSPQVIKNYTGGDISLPGAASRVIRVAENPELIQLIGKTIITTDGTTLLGADDKAGVAVMMELAATLLEHPGFPHAEIRLLFTCDEEIGHGADHVDLNKLAADVAYTLDGAGANEIDVETFSADLATITFRGVNIHPSIAKGKMINAMRAAGEFLSRLPRVTLAPEVTSERQGFVHPYHIEGGVAEAKVQVLLRDFDSSKLELQASLLKTIAQQVELDFPGLTIDALIQAQYRNLGDGLANEPRAVRLAELAHRGLGRVPRLTVIRGGTDGAHLTAKGLPTPNLSTGEHNPHSPLEWTCLEEMSMAVEICMELARLWGLEKASS
jgi:tripeptide aminopeptidase